MANQEQLEQLQRGTQDWNTWRREHPAIAINLSHTDLRGIDLNGADLSLANLSFVDLSLANLSRADLEGADLSHIDLSRATLSYASLSRTHLNHIDLREAELNGADLREATLSDIDLSYADLSRTTLSRATLTNSILRGATLTNSILREATLSDIDFSYANLSGVDLRGVDLSRHIDLGGVILSYGNLSYANLSGADLREADFSYANLSRAYHSRKFYFRRSPRSIAVSGGNFSGADLSYATLREANFFGANFGGADLSYATLREANFFGANFSGADLRETDLNRTDFSGADLNRADLSYATVGDTLFTNIDLRTTKGLDTVKHLRPSTIGTDTLMRSQGDIPVTFLRGTGLSDIFIEYIHSLVSTPIQYYTCFISYSSKDQEFAELLYADLQSRGVRCWYAPHDLQPGTYIRQGIDKAIRNYDKLVLILSENAIQSGWVEYEVEITMLKERERKSLMLFPIRIDQAILTCREGWATTLRARHIGDFTTWKQNDTYQQAFTRLLRHLKAETPLATE